ncbi:MAG: histidine kinase, partial [Ignavibacterium sp.]
MQLSQLKTYFDTPERTPFSIIEAERKTILNTSCIQSILEGFPHLALILDRNRQIVAYNSKAFKYFIGSNGDGVYGKRLGEALNCIHSREMEAGCGTSMFCRECGAAQAIKRTNETSKYSFQECRITVNKNNLEEALDFRVHTTKIHIEGEDYIIFSVEDIQNEKRRLVLERIFFHDVLNTAAAIRGIAEILSQLKDEKEFEEFSAMLLKSSDQLIDEIHAQRDLLYAENGILKINLLEV